MSEVCGAVLSDSIENEKNGKRYCYTPDDRAILDKMFEEINEAVNGNYHYLAEIDFNNIEGSGHIMLKYITRFKSESVRAFLISQIVHDVGKDCAEKIYRLYLHFKESDYYISKPEEPAPAHIYVRYDNAFKQLKPKKLRNELLELIRNPRDAHYLPFTIRMLASWKLPEIEKLLLSYLDSENITNQELGIYDNRTYFPSATFIRRELKFTAIHGLKYFPSDKNAKLIKRYTEDTDADIRVCAMKTMKAYEKALGALSERK